VDWRGEERLDTLFLDAGLGKGRFGICGCVCGDVWYEICINCVE
jgi:hypothetical protein